MVEKKKPGKPLSADTEKVRKYLASIDDADLATLKPKVYRKRTHHVGCTDAIFQMEKMRAKNLRGLVVKRAKGPRPRTDGRIMTQPKTARVPLSVPFAGRSFEIIAVVPLELYKEVPLKLLKDFATAVLKQCFGENENAVQLLLLADPPTLEIRRPTR